MTTNDKTNELSDYEKQQLAEERRKAQIWVDLEADRKAQDTRAAEITNMDRASPVEFDRLKRKLFKETEAAEAAKAAKQKAAQ
ncbi:MAG TPA: hypothetical protein VEI98_06585 [Xanthobacteraceae bacterium]|nr:hypothetical protein [Xanthobacteraceae bacterium]